MNARISKATDTGRSADHVDGEGHSQDANRKAWLLFVAALTILVPLTGCGTHRAQAQSTTPAAPQPTVIEVAVTEREATIEWQHHHPATGYRIAWINIDQMTEAIQGGTPWSEQLA